MGMSRWKKAELAGEVEGREEFVTENWKSLLEQRDEQIKRLRKEVARMNHSVCVYKSQVRKQDYLRMKAIKDSFVRGYEQGKSDGEDAKEIDKYLESSA